MPLTLPRLDQSLAERFQLGDELCVRDVKGAIAPKSGEISMVKAIIVVVFRGLKAKKEVRGRAEGIQVCQT